MVRVPTKGLRHASSRRFAPYAHNCLRVRSPAVSRIRIHAANAAAAATDRACAWPHCSLPTRYSRRCAATHSASICARADPIWRIPAALAFFWYGAQGLLPPVFVRNAGWGDLIAGIAAIPVVFWLPQRAWRRTSLIGFYCFSFADFVIAVGTGFTFSLLGDPLMATLKTFPMALIPLFGVPLTGSLSIIALHRLAIGRD